MIYTFHVGIAPYTDGHGVTRAHYQWLRPDGYAIADVAVIDGAVESAHVVDDHAHCLPAFKDEAVAHATNKGGGYPAKRNPDLRYRE